MAPHPLGFMMVPVHLQVTFSIYNGSQQSDSLHQLDSMSWRWKELSTGGGPMRKSGCGMITQLTLLGAYGFPSGPTPPGAEFIQDTRFTDSMPVGWTNELHTFDLEEGDVYLNIVGKSHYVWNQELDIVMACSLSSQPLVSLAPVYAVKPSLAGPEPSPDAAIACKMSPLEMTADL